MDRRIKIRHLQALTEIVRQGSLKRAAEQLFLTQPAISRTLAELEEIAGAKLLQRGRAGIALTAKGEFFHSFARSSLSALERGLSGLSEVDEAATVSFRIGALPSVAALLMPTTATLLATLAPQMRLVIADGSHADLIRMLKIGELDLVIGRLGAPETMRGLNFVQLYLEEVAIVVRPGHPILADPDLRRIGEWPVIYPPPWAAIRPLVERLLIAEGIAVPQQRIETVSVAFGHAHTLSSDAIWFISAGVVAQETRRGQLMRLPVTTRLTEGPVGIMTRLDMPESMAQKLFFQAVLKATAQLDLS